MARTVVPPPRGARAAGSLGQGDGISEKIIKYVPAETLAFFVPATAAAGADEEGWLIVALIAGALGNFGWLWLSAQSITEEAKRPLRHFYVLAIVAFGCWAIATSPAVAELIGVGDVAAGLILLLGVFLIPLADGILNVLHARRSGGAPAAEVA